MAAEQAHLPAASIVDDYFDIGAYSYYVFANGTSYQRWNSSDKNGLALGGCQLVSRETSRRRTFIPTQPTTSLSTSTRTRRNEPDPDSVLTA